MAIFLAVVGSLAAVVGLMALSNATQGVGLIAFGCFLAILSRLAQAHDHHRKAFPPTPAPEWKPAPPQPMSTRDKAIIVGIFALGLAAVAFMMYWNSLGKPPR